jgi:small ligand-binding sensory domain FIST
VTVAAGSGLGRGASPAAAALDAALGALARSGQDHAPLALVFMTADASPVAHEVLHTIRRVTGARTVVGCSGAGVLTEAGEVEGEPAVAVLVVGDAGLLARAHLVEGPAEIDAAAGARVARDLEGTLAEGGCLVLFPDAVGLDPSGLLDGVRDVLGFVPAVGAVAAGTPMFEVSNTAATSSGLAALALGGAPPTIGVAQGCAPIGEPYVITRAEDTVIREIGSRPAVTVLREAIESVPGGVARVQRAGIFAGLALDPGKSPLTRGDFLVRNLVGLDRDSGAVAVAEPTRTGQTIQFQIRDAQASREDLLTTLDDVRRRLGDRRPGFGCYFDCAGRGRGLFGVPDHDVALIRERLGDFPLAGFFGNGEFAPVGRQNYFHTYTGVLVLF